MKAGVGTYGKVDSILFRWMKIISLLLHDMSNSIPVRAKLALKAEDYPWSSASAHLSGRDDMLVKVAPLLEMVDDWAEVLAAEVKEQELKEIRKHECTGRPLGNVIFLERLESELGRTLHRRKPGPKTRNRKN